MEDEVDNKGDEEECMEDEEDVDEYVYLVVKVKYLKEEEDYEEEKRLKKKVTRSGRCIKNKKWEDKHQEKRQGGRKKANWDKVCKGKSADEAPKKQKYEKKKRGERKKTEEKAYPEDNLEDEYAKEKVEENNVKREDRGHAEREGWEKEHGEQGNKREEKKADIEGPQKVIGDTVDRQEKNRDAVYDKEEEKKKREEASGGYKDEKNWEKDYEERVPERVLNYKNDYRQGENWAAKCEEDSKEDESVKESGGAREEEDWKRDYNEPRFYDAQDLQWPLDHVDYEEEEEEEETFNDPR